MTLDERLRDELERRASMVDPRTEAMLHRSTRTGHQAARRRRVVVALMSATAAILLVATVPQVIDSFEPDRLGPAAKLTPPSEDLPVYDFTVGQQMAWGLVAGEASTEIASVGADGTVTRDVAQLPFVATDIAFGAGDLWVSSASGVARLSTEGTQVAQTPVPGARRIAFFDEQLFVSTDAGDIVVLNATTSKASEPFRVCSGAGDPIPTGGSLWVNCDPPLVRVDLGKREVVATYPALLGLDGDERGIWVKQLRTGEIHMLDAETGQQGLQIDYRGQAAITWGERFAWVTRYRDGRGWLTPYDTRSGRPIASREFALPTGARLPVIISERRIWIRHGQRGIFSIPEPI